MHASSHENDSVHWNTSVSYNSFCVWLWLPCSCQRLASWKPVLQADQDLCFHSKHLSVSSRELVVLATQNKYSRTGNHTDGDSDLFHTKILKEHELDVTSRYFTRYMQSRNCFQNKNQKLFFSRWGECPYTLSCRSNTHFPAFFFLTLQCKMAWL